METFSRELLQLPASRRITSRELIRCYDVKLQEEMPGLEDSKSVSATEAAVPMVRVQLVESTKVLPQQSTAVCVKLDGCRGSTGTWVLEPDLELRKSGLCMELFLLEVVQDEAQVIVTNPTGFTQ